MYYSEFDIELDSCASYDFDCRATCTCLEGFYGADCHFTKKNEVETIKVMRETLCTNLLKTTAMQDIDASVIIQRASTVTDLLIDPDQISDQGFIQCARFFIETLLSNTPAINSITSATYVYKALSAIAVGDRIGLLSLSLSF